jgi:peptidoglycan/xylan/chitin deacetylase (PgdA/CDA1 family)
MLEVMTIERWAQLIWRAADHECEITCAPREVIHRQESLKNYEAPLARPLPSIQDLSKAEHEFGLSTTPVEKWTRVTVDWYRDHYIGGNSDG